MFDEDPTFINFIKQITKYSSLSIILPKISRTCGYSTYDMVIFDNKKYRSGQDFNCLLLIT